VALFDAINSVDRPSICEALAKEIVAQKRRPGIVRAGSIPARSRRRRASRRQRPTPLSPAAAKKYGLSISGLMCIPPVDDAPAPHFALTAKIAARNGLKNLSMGMSADFAIAIQFGATHVRVGSAIFGAR